MEKQKEESFIYNKTNYLLIVSGVLVMAIGFILMSGGGTEDLNQFNGAELFSTRRITLAPLTVLAGLGIVLFGILKKPQ